MLGKSRVVIVGLVLACAIIVPVFAYVYFSQANVKYLASGVVIRAGTPTDKIGVYWDAACTTPVNSLDFGDVFWSGQQKMLSLRVYIRNEGNVTITVFYNSTLDSVSTEITEWWCVRPDFQWGIDPVNGTLQDKPGDVWVTCYGIKIPPFTNAGTYNWTLTIWGEY